MLIKMPFWQRTLKWRSYHIVHWAGLTKSTTMEIISHWQYAAFQKTLRICNGLMHCHNAMTGLSIDKRTELGKTRGHIHVMWIIYFRICPVQNQKCQHETNTLTCNLSKNQDLLTLRESYPSSFSWKQRTASAPYTTITSRLQTIWQTGRTWE